MVVVPPTEHDDQEIDHEFEREAGVQPEDFGAERAAQAGQARADREGQQEDAVDVEPQARRRPAGRPLTARSCACRSGCG